MFSKIAVFLMYRERYVHVFVIIKQPTQHIGICNEAILTQIPCSGAALTWSYIKKMTVPIPRGVCKHSESEIRLSYPVCLCCVFTITSQALWVVD